MGISRIFYDGCMLSNNPWKTQTTEWRITFMSHKNTMEGPWKSKENFHDQWKFYIIHRIFIILGDPGVVSRAAREKVRRKWKSPWLPTLTGPFPNGQENAGNKKCFVLLCPIGEQFLVSSFREFVHDGYYVATVARFVHKACAYKGNFHFLLS